MGRVKCPHGSKPTLNPDSSLCMEGAGAQTQKLWDSVYLIILIPEMPDQSTRKTNHTQTLVLVRRTVASPRHWACVSLGDKRLAGCTNTTGQPGSRRRSHAAKATGSVRYRPTRYNLLHRTCGLGMRRKETAVHTRAGGCGGGQGRRSHALEQLAIHTPSVPA